MKFTIETKYIVPEEFVGTDKEEASYETILEKVVDGKSEWLRIITNKFADNDKEERRIQLLILYTNIGQTLQKEQFPNDTRCYKSTEVDGVTRYHSPFYPEDLESSQ